MPNLSGGPLPARIRTALLAYVFGVLGAFLLAAPWSSLWDYATLALAQYATWPLVAALAIALALAFRMRETYPKS